MKHLEFSTSLINKNYKHILEFGIYKGTTIKLLRNLLDDSFKLFGFDSFDGLPEDWVSSDYNMIALDGYCKKGFFKLDEKDIPIIEGVNIYKGLFKDTLQDYIKIAEPIGLLHIDSDLYSSAIEILYKLNDFIVEDTIIIFDEWRYRITDSLWSSDHERKAFYEWSNFFDRKFEFIDFFDKNNNEFQIIKIKSNYKNNMKKTIFLDIDGCLIKHKGNLTIQINEKPELLPGVLDKLNQWEADGHRIILTTGRKESMRKFTENQMLELGIFYDQLIMGLNRGERIIINDSKKDSDMITASAIQIKRNDGLININI